jgi:acetolactate synthase-1/2/3 large subunit
LAKLLDNALATMGAGHPSAMAARLVYLQKLIVAVCGDASFIMYSQKLKTAVRMKTNLIAILNTELKRRGALV